MSQKNFFGRKLFAMFADDRAFALAIVIWVLGYWLLVSRYLRPAALQAVILFAGFAAILICSLPRYLRRGRREGGVASRDARMLRSR